MPWFRSYSIRHPPSLRYFFTHTNVNRKLRFCDSELSAIRARTMRDVICDNTNVTGVPYDSFRHDTDNVLVVPCSERNILLPDLGCEPGGCGFLSLSFYPTNSLSSNFHSAPNDFDEEENETEEDFEGGRVERKHRISWGIVANLLTTSNRD